VAQILKETASGGGRWTSDLGFGVIDVAGAIAQAQAGHTGVLLSGLRLRSRVKLNWSGDAAAYTLTLATDGHAPRALLATTRQTSTSVDLRHGHTYSFSVTALDAAGSPTAVSPPLTVSGP
jgi:hypothetical protein